MRAVTRLALVVTGALLVASPSALAGWSAQQRIEREPFPEPRVGLVAPADDATPWAVRFRGGETVAIPGSEAQDRSRWGPGRAASSPPRGR